MALKYTREYRTYFHIATCYGVIESVAYKIARWVEDALIKDLAFVLPGRKALLKSDMEYEVLLIDAVDLVSDKSSIARKTLSTRELASSLVDKALKTKNVIKIAFISRSTYSH